MVYRSSLHLGVVAIEKGAFVSPSTKVANFTLLLFRFIIKAGNRLHLPYSPIW